MDQQVKFLKAYEEMQRWLSQPELSPKLKRELLNLEDRLVRDSGDKEAKEEIYDRFCKNLNFGTGGLRGIIGAGTNRLNIYTIRRATQGLSDYLNRKYSGSEKELSVVIAYDSRINSKSFAVEAGCVFSANGFKVYIFPELMPSPALSFAVRYYGCCAGVMITASHNPAIYNGYKVFNDEGCQVTQKAAAEILDSIEKTDIFAGIKYCEIDVESCIEGVIPNKDLEKIMTVIPDKTADAYIDAVLKNRIGITCDNIEVVYTPLNGAGNMPVRRVLQEIGVGRVHIVPEQENPDGNFHTCPYPNPEKEEAMIKGLALCSELGTPDILTATDPDCDRLGVAAKHKDAQSDKFTYKILTGNEIGILLFDFICSNKVLPERPVAIKTIVSSRMADEVASHYNVEMINVLTGFKYIGEQIGILETNGEADRFIFGFEESNGFLTGSYARDKDAVNAVMLICEAAAYYKKQGKTLIDRMNELYETYGYYKNKLVEFTLEGVDGMEKMNKIMTSLRIEAPKEIAGKKVRENADYLYSERKVYGRNCSMATGVYPVKLPKADVLEYIFDDRSSLFVRPSGTEPKLKIYLSAKGSSFEESCTIIENMEHTVKGWINK